MWDPYTVGSIKKIESVQRAARFTLDVDVVDLRAQADASMPASNNNVIIIQYI